MKIKKNMQEHIDNLNAELKGYAERSNSVVFNQVENTDNDYAQGSLVFDKFTVLFRCHYGGSGYSFMEEPILNTKNTVPIGCVEATYEPLFVFKFSEIPFSIYDIHNTVNDRIFRTLCFHHVLNSDDSIFAVSQILSFIDENLYAINQIPENPTLQETIKKNYFNDERIFNPNLNIDEFNDDIETNAENHENLMLMALSIQDGVHNYIVTGNYKLLVKQFNKAEKKNTLITFEKRYQEYLYDNNFPQADAEISNRIIKKDEKSRASKFFNIFFIFGAYVSAAFASGLITKTIIKRLYPESIVLGCTTSEIFYLFFLLGVSLSLYVLVYNLPLSFIKERVSPLFKKEHNKIILFNAIVVTLISIFWMINTYSNHAIVIYNDGLYVEKQAVTANGNHKFVLITGREDESGKNYFDDVSDRTLIYVYNDNYEDYVYCSIETDTGYVTDEILQSIKKSDADFSSYRTLNEFAESNNIKIN